MRRSLTYGLIGCLLSAFLFFSDVLVARERRSSRSPRRAEVSHNIISVGDEFALRNLTSGKYIARDPLTGKITFSTSYEDFPGAVCKVKYASDNKEKALKTQEPVYIQFRSKKNLATGKDWRELVASESKDKDAQWRFFAVGSDLVEPIYDGDQVLIQNVSNPNQYLFTYFKAFPVHDKVNIAGNNEPADEYAKHAVYIIEKVKKDKEPAKELIKEPGKQTRRVIREEEKLRVRSIRRPAEQKEVVFTEIEREMFQPSQEPEGEQPERRVIRRPAGQQEKVEEEPSQERKQVITPPTGTIPTAPPLPTVVPGTVPPAPPVPTAPVIPKAPEIKTTPEIEKKLDRPSRPASFLEEIRARAGKPVKKEEKAVGDIPKAPPLPTVTSGTVPSAPSVPTAPVIPKAPEIKTAPTPEKTQPSLEGDLRARLARIAAATKKDDDDDDY